MKTYTSTTVHDLRNLAVRAYLQHGGGEAGVEAAWMEIRARLVNLRAPRAIEAIARNGSRAKSYRSPIGGCLCIPGATHHYGHHAATYPRTVRSLREASEVKQAILSWFDAESTSI